MSGCKAREILRPVARRASDAANPWSEIASQSLATGAADGRLSTASSEERNEE